MLPVSWDKLHRLIRDIKLTLKHACGGIFLKCPLYTSFVWGLNYKPFGTGVFRQEKKAFLDFFLAGETVDSPIFRKYAADIAEDLELPCMTEEDVRAVFGALAALPSFVSKASLPKLGRWFSWNAVCKEQLREFSALRMLLDHHCTVRPGG